VAFKKMCHLGVIERNSVLKSNYKNISSGLQTELEAMASTEQQNEGKENEDERAAFFKGTRCWSQF